MNGDTTADLQDLIDRLRHGDDSARRALLERVYHRLRRIAAATLQRQFPRLRTSHELDSVVDEAWAQLMKALETARPPTAEAFYRLAFRKVRHVLLDMARRQGRLDARREAEPPGPDGSDSRAPLEIGDTTHEPSRLAFWTEIHREVARLPQDQRTVFRFHYFLAALKGRQANLGSDHPETLTAMSNVASTYRDTGRLADALPLYEQVLKGLKGKLGPERPHTLTAMSLLVRTYLLNGQPAKAEPIARESLKVREQKQQDDWAVFETRSLLGGCRLDQ
jgi:DNA-directed RNA polymerase specialized sigma24 family protein